MTKKCFYCNDVLTEAHFLLGKATLIAPKTYAHHDCVDSLEDGSIANEQAQHILEAADSAHQGIEVARSLLHEALRDMGKILTHGSDSLGFASLGSTMRLGQLFKEAAFLLGALRGDAHGLCILLGKDLGVLDDECKGMSAGPPRSSDKPGYREEMFDHEDRLLGDESEEYDDDECPC